MAGAITEYKVTPYIGAEAQTPVKVGASATSATITGLSNGDSLHVQGERDEHASARAKPPRPRTRSHPRTRSSNSATAVVLDSGDSSSVELGVKFKSTVNGRVTGIRFYKAAANTGPHVGSLWSATGTLLASATFTIESASGWQQVTFPEPVAITAGTTYVAGYFAPHGHYSASSNAFSSGGVPDLATASARERSEQRRRLRVQRPAARSRRAAIRRPTTTST